MPGPVAASEPTAVSESTTPAARLLHDHRVALATGDLDRAVRHYAEGAIVFADHGVDRGREEIRRSLERLVAAAGDVRPEVTEEVETPVLDGRATLVRVRFRVQAPGLPVGDGCDVYLLRDGRILAQSAHLALPGLGGTGLGGLPAPSELPGTAELPPAAVVAAPTIAETVARLLEAAGVRRVFGIVGGPCGPLYDAIARSRVEIVQTRHEGGAVFAALEHHHAGGDPAVALVTTGPGFLNALNAVAAARWDRAKLVLLSASTAVAQWGRGAAQETGPHSAVGGCLFDRGLFDFAVPCLGADDLPQVVRRLRTGLAQRGGFVAHVSLPTSTQTARVAGDAVSRAIAAPTTVVPPAAPPAVVREVAHGLAQDGFAMWVGAGGASAAGAVRALAERAGVGVMCSPRGKGVFPESHPQFVGVTGLGGHASVGAFLRAERPARLLVLGTRLSEVTSLWDPSMVPPQGFVHVDLDPSAFGAAYPDAPTLGVQADVGAFVTALLDAMPLRPPRRRPLRPEGAATVHPPAVSPRREGPVRPQALMDALQAVVVERADAPVLSESGSAFAWTNHRLRFSRPGRYRVSMTWASMGHMACGVVGAALGRGGKAVAVVGDGSMMMGQEISTAVATRAPAVWVVLNDGRQGIVAQAMGLQGLLPAGTEYPRVDFVALAKSLGADGEAVARETDLVPALERAIAARGPDVLDVAIDRDELSPMLAQRVESLRMQGALREAAS